MTLILGIFSAILWTFFVILLGYQGGKASVEQLNEGIEGPPGPLGPVGATGASGPVGPAGKCEHEDRVAELERNIVDINAILTGFNDRFTRVERKSGMSV